MDPSEIAYLAYTKAAAKAAAMKIFETEDETRMAQQYPYFRTLHSLCYRSLKGNYPDKRLITTSDMKAFAQRTSFEGTYTVHKWEDLADVFAGMKDRGRNEWDYALSAYHISRIKAMSIEDLEKARREPCDEGLMIMGRENMQFDIYSAFVLKYEAFKEEEGLIDFTDMLEYGLREMLPLHDVRFVVLDECQDLAPIHHAMVDRLFSHAEEIWWAGDDDQSLFLFNGASAELFLKRAERAQHQIQLRQTHRFGQQIVDFADQIIQRVANRHPKEIIGVKGREGKINLTGGFEPVTGDVLILHRHVQGCQNIAQVYMDAGLPFRNERGKDPLEYTNRIKAWQAIEYLSQGETVPATQAAMIIEDLMPSKIVSNDNTAVRLITHGGKSKLDEKLKGAVRLYDLVEGNIITPEGAQVIKDKDYSVMKYASDLEYYERVSKNGYDVGDTENLPKITTIHGSKGRQAERVVVFTEMGNRCWDDFDTEHRLAYVAATRTKTDLTICLDDKVAWAKSDYDYPVDNEEKNICP